MSHPHKIIQASPRSPGQLVSKPAPCPSGPCRRRDFWYRAGIGRHFALRSSPWKKDSSLRYDTGATQPCEDQVGCLVGRHLRRVDPNLGTLGLFIRGIDACEVLELSLSRLPIESLRVARLGDLQRRIDEQFEELARLHQLARHAAFRP